MRILTIGPVGVVAMQRVLGWLAEHGDEVWVVDEEETYRNLVPEGFRFTALPLPPASEAASSTWYSAAAAELHRIADEFQPEVVHLHSIPALGPVCVEANLQPLLVSTWGVLAQRLGQTTVHLPPAIRQTLAAADAVIVDSPSLLTSATAIARMDAHVTLLPMGADTQRFRPGRTEAALLWRTLFGIPDDAFVLLSPRMWGEFYGHQTILQAYARAFPRFNQVTRLALVGLGNGPTALPHMAKAWTQVAGSEAAATVRWLPRVSYREMPTLYAMSDAVVNYPEFDSFAATLVEAAACELPIITPLLPTYRDTFLETACSIVPAQGMSTFVDVMVALVNQLPFERHDRLAQARAVVQRDYDDSTIKQRLWSLYAKLARKR